MTAKELIEQLQSFSPTDVIEGGVDDLGNLHIWAATQETYQQTISVGQKKKIRALTQKELETLKVCGLTKKNKEEA